MQGHAKRRDPVYRANPFHLGGAPSGARTSRGIVVGHWRRAKATGRSGERFDLLRKLQVVLGDPALGVCREGHLDLAPGDGDVRVVIHLLSRTDERVDELHRADEVAAIEALDDVLATLTPAVKALGK